ncbi:hypothetical protein TWF718_010920 [Orbilia javanica]|uniref:Uncharacterized protein n=1 Tax=Orbilia javanica TaxID=47235 RepID=A0AAN8MN41_9PEZI
MIHVHGVIQSTTFGRRGPAVAFFSHWLSDWFVIKRGGVGYHDNSGKVASSASMQASKVRKRLAMFSVMSKLSALLAGIREFAY